MISIPTPTNTYMPYFLQIYAKHADSVVEVDIPMILDDIGGVFVNGAYSGNSLANFRSLVTFMCQKCCFELIKDNHCFVFVFLLVLKLGSFRTISRLNYLRSEYLHR